MKILVTGAGGFAGKNLVQSLLNIKNGKDRTHPDLKIDDVFCYDIDTEKSLLDAYCAQADFVFNFAGVNRPVNTSEFMQGNCDFLSTLLASLKRHGNKCPVVLSSSIQASLIGRYAGSEYGISKKEAENLLFDYSRQNGTDVYVYRFPNLFGKWCRPNYNSVIATFCSNIANGLPIVVNDRQTLLELVYIDDLVDEMICALEGKAHRCCFDGTQAVPDENGQFCFVPVSHKVTLGEIADSLEKISSQPSSLIVPEIPDNSFTKKLYSTYLSYLPKEKVSIPLKMNVDDRGSFTELLKTENAGQFSVNVSKPGIIKGQHWHHSKWEFFIVVSGKALIQERRIDSDEIMEFYVSGDKPEAVHMLPGYTHNIINLSDTENLVTLMWANEIFNPAKPDTYFEPVEE